MISKEVIKKIITDNQNRQFLDLWPRTLKIPTDIEKIITLTGVRRSGKTYQLFNLMNQLSAKGIPRERLFYLNFEDERLQFSPDELDLILQAYQELYPSINLANCYFFFDEIQETRNWEKFIRRVHDSISKHVFITGSNARLLSQEIATALRGRTITFESYPLSFIEFVNIQSPGLNRYRSIDRAALVNLFEHFMHHGGFPELIHMKDDFKEKLLQEYFNVMLFRDLIERYQISNSATLKYFCKRVIGNSAGEFSVNKIYNELKSMGYKVSKDSLYTYQNQIESVYLTRFISKWSSSVIKTESSLKKCYVIDPGLGAAMDYKFSQDQGRLLETTVALELIKQGKSITYQQNGWECDFLVSEKNRLTAAIQVSADLSDGKTKDREIRGLVQTCLTNNLPEGTLLTLDQTEELTREGVKIRILPAWEFFYST